MTAVCERRTRDFLVASRRGDDVNHIWPNRLEHGLDTIEPLNPRSNALKSLPGIGQGVYYGGEPGSLDTAYGSRVMLGHFAGANQRNH